MILSSAPQNEAIISNVGEIGEFRIRNSAKAFSILSSGLYANKIKAIIRELSCNATDSHVAAGNVDTPFDVHLPNSLEPWFSIRDYGTGLSHAQVTQIYTTYFESTKTASNEFIGALGLGSKSPFSYTDNFTVTAIKDGVKGVYTAFINESGVPSIAKMMDESTTEPSGVEVRFAVEERYDFGKFRDEARSVYTYFKQRPIVSGDVSFEFRDPTYIEKDIIPGVHSTESHRYGSIAIMGNIAYPIDVPQADKALGHLHTLLNCGLVMEFGIGELDFQASREGLSYIPQTINAIKAKLEVLNGQLAVHVAQEADKIENLWERATYLYKRKDETLWNAAVVKYVTDTKFPLMDVTTPRYDSLKLFNLNVKTLASKYNIALRGFTKSRGTSTCSNIKVRGSYVNSGPANNQTSTYVEEWQIRVSDDVYFVFNDTKVGATERAKAHWKNNSFNNYQSNVYIIETCDKTKPVKLDQFYKDLMTPPADQCMKASDLDAVERAAGMGKNVTIMSLEESQRGGYWSRRTESVWRDAGKADTFDNKTTFYYLPLSGYQCKGVVEDAKALCRHLKQSGIFTGTIYGVRKADQEWVMTQKNWINLDTFVQAELAKMNVGDVMGLVKKAIDFNELYQYNATKHITDSNSPYIKLFNVFKDVKVTDETVRSALEYLCRVYTVNTKNNVDPGALITKYTDEVAAIKQRYPLIKGLSKYSTEGADVAEYINLIDQTKGV
jgi:hypothetical protein